jgi:uncharacterized protein YndB with AHSA1/START domain
VAKGRLGDPLANRVGPRDRVVELRHVFSAPREQLFRAWTDPAEFTKWWGPVGWTAYDCDLDVRPGGRWRSSFRRPGQPSIHIGGIYHEVVPPERLAFSWDSYGDLAAADRLSLVTIEFLSLGSQTELLLTHRKLTTGEAEDMDVGWISAFECLEAYLAGAEALERRKNPGSRNEPTA